MSILKTIIRRGTYGEKERTAARPSGRDHQGRYSAVHGPFGNRRRKSSRRVPTDASRDPGGAQATLCSHVPEDIPPVWRLARSMDEATGGLRPEEGGAKQEGYGTCRADRSRKTGRRSSSLRSRINERHFLPQRSTSGRCARSRSTGNVALLSGVNYLYWAA